MYRDPTEERSKRSPTATSSSSSSCRGRSFPHTAPLASPDQIAGQNPRLPRSNPAAWSPGSLGSPNRASNSNSSYYSRNPIPFPIRMGDGDGRRCPKHPSEPPFTGFCSACLLDRLHATNLIGVASPSQPPAPPPPLPLHQDPEEPPPPCCTDAAGTRREGAERTTLLRLFQLEDQGEDTKAAAPSTSTSTSGGGDGQDPPPLLHRKRSLPRSCSEWIACCDANHSSCLPSRQSLDASSSATSAAAAAAANPHHPNDAAASSRGNGVAMVERRTGSLRWNQLWPIKGLLGKPADHLFSRSFSESSRSRYALQPGGGAIARSSSSQSQGNRLNGSRSMSSAGNVMDSSEISLPGDSVGRAHLHHCRPRLKDRLHWFRRSHSVHYPSPTNNADAGFTPFRSRSSSTRSATHKNQRRFAAGFFAAQRHRH